MTRERLEELDTQYGARAELAVEIRRAWKQITELQEHNNGEVEKRRKLEAELAEARRDITPGFFRPDGCYVPPKGPLNPGCYCAPGKCMAPVIMGQQMPCRDPGKRDAAREGK